MWKPLQSVAHLRVKLGSWAAYVVRDQTGKHDEVATSPLHAAGFLQGGTSTQGILRIPQGRWADLTPLIIP